PSAGRAGEWAAEVKADQRSGMAGRHQSRCVAEMATAKQATAAQRSKVATIQLRLLPADLASADGRGVPGWCRDSRTVCRWPGQRGESAASRGAAATPYTVCVESVLSRDGTYPSWCSRECRIVESMVGILRFAHYHRSDKAGNGRADRGRICRDGCGSSTRR